MTHEFRVADKVQWDSSGGTSEGSVKSGGKAVHEPDALRRKG